MFTFTYRGKIRSQGRPRFDGRSRRTYEADADKAYKAAILAAFMEQGGMRHGRFGSAPIVLTVETFRPLPKSRPKRITEEPDTFKPDADNIQKAVQDALNGYAYDDDAQIVDGRTIKHPRRRIDQEYMVVTIRKAD